MWKVLQNYCVKKIKSLIIHVCVCVKIKSTFSLYTIYCYPKPFKKRYILLTKVCKHNCTFDSFYDPSNFNDTFCANDNFATAVGPIMIMG